MQLSHEHVDGSCAYDSLLPLVQDQLKPAACSRFKLQTILLFVVQESALVVLEVTLKAEAERAAAAEAEDRRQQQELLERTPSGNGDGSRSCA
jgi:FKBP-type peptidyl-prolyl cis-trans isomerase (trigger factor)